jgi:ADP-ribose pyrophosphatase YjhB (NUDIX family)
VHAIPVTPSGTIILVKLSYAPHWRLPGGGFRRGESALGAVLRELAEEIGMNGHGAVEEFARERLGRTGRPRGSLFIVRDVEYRPRRTLEIADVREFDLDRLPPDLLPYWRMWIEQARPRLSATS